MIEGDAPEYLAQPPWVGPVLGMPLDDRGTLRLAIGGGSDPLLGNAVACLLLPARKRDGARMPDAIWERALVARIRCDANGLFRIAPELGTWIPGSEGVWMVLLYQHSVDPWHPIYEDAFGVALAALEPSLLKEKYISFPSLPPALQAEIRKGVDGLPRDKLEAALIPRVGDPVAQEITFAVASCQYPAGFLDGDIAQQSYERLAQSVESDSGPKCLLLLGDQVYVDATAGLFDPSALHDRYHLPYERFLRTGPVRRILRRIPAFMMLDDHEIEDNWEPGNGGEENLMHGRLSYLAYQRIAGPDPWLPDRLWHGFEFHGFPFFLADTRSEREARTAQTVRSANIMSELQFDTLLKWLEHWKGHDVPIFIASPAALLPRHARAASGSAGALRSDAWDGYPRSLHRLLAYIARNKIHNVVFLSGDAHTCFDTTAALTAAGSAEEVVVRSIHASALYAPFRFANAIENDFCNEAFGFTDPDMPAESYRCELSTKFPHCGDGYAELHVHRGSGNKWDVDCTFK